MLQSQQLEPYVCVNKDCQAPSRIINGQVDHVENHKKHEVKKLSIIMKNGKKEYNKLFKKVSEYDFAQKLEDTIKELIISFTDYCNTFKNQLNEQFQYGIKPIKIFQQNFDTLLKGDYNNEQLIASNDLEKSLFDLIFIESEKKKVKSLFEQQKDNIKSKLKKFKLKTEKFISMQDTQDAQNIENTQNIQDAQNTQNTITIQNIQNFQNLQNIEKIQQYEEKILQLEMENSTLSNQIIDLVNEQEQQDTQSKIEIMKRDFFVFTNLMGNQNMNFRQDEQQNQKPEFEQTVQLLQNQLKVASQEIDRLNKSLQKAENQQTVPQLQNQLKVASQEIDRLNKILQQQKEEIQSLIFTQGQLLQELDNLRYIIKEMENQQSLKLKLDQQELEELEKQQLELFFEQFEENIQKLDKQKQQQEEQNPKQK